MKEWCAALVLWLSVAATAAPGALVVADFEEPQEFRIAESVAGSLRYEFASEENRGHFLCVEFTRLQNSGFAYIYLPIADALSGSAEDYDGISFMVRGDGSSTFGTVEMRFDGFVNIFQAVFPLDCTEWRRVDIRWDEFFQMNDGVRKAEMNWDTLNRFALGSRGMWGSCSYAIDDIALASIEPREPRQAYRGMARLERTGEKLRKEGAQLTIAALGDSITFGTRLPADEREDATYLARLAAGIEERFAGAAVKTVNAGVGGDTIARGIVRIGHQVAYHEPDLVLVYLGANDAMYALPESRVRHAMSLLVEKLLETTDADILLLGPTQILGKPGLPESYGRIYASIARERGVAYFDLSEALSMLTESDFRNALADNVHLSAYGHRVIADAILDFVAERVQR